MAAGKGTGLNQVTLWRDATRLLRLIEDAVRRFPRYHKYTLGSDLRHQAMGVCRLILRAWHAREDRARQIERLVLAVDDLKLILISPNAGNAWNVNFNNGNDNANNQGNNNAVRLVRGGE